MFRDRLPMCPTCGTELVSAGSVRGCSTCSGVWVTEQVLTEMVWDLHAGAETEPLAWQPRDGEPRVCPVCEQAMATVTLETVPVDRCRVHGVWLDAGELAATLHRSASRPPRADGIKLDLSPIEPNYTRGTTDAAMEAERAGLLRAWFAGAVRDVHQQTVGVERGIIDDAVANLVTALRDKPPIERPTCDCAVVFASRVEAAAPDARYLREAKTFVETWCVPYGVLAESFADLSVTGDGVRAYFDALAPAIDELTLVFAPGDILAAHSRVLDVLNVQRESLGSAFDAARKRDRVETDRHLGRFMSTFSETEDALSTLIARTT
jgi:Zn-finger nucleic acid-binding protein